MYTRWITAQLARDLQKPLVHILFGARQTGKTTLLQQLVPRPALSYDLADPQERTRLLADPGAFRRECEALPTSRDPSLVVVDEAQAVPTVFDAVQVLFDRHPRRWRFVLCGSSARKLRKSSANLRPGRSLLPNRPRHEMLASRCRADFGGQADDILEVLRFPIPIDFRVGSKFLAHG